MQAKLIYLIFTHYTRQCPHKNAHPINLCNLPAMPRLLNNTEPVSFSRQTNRHYNDEGFESCVRCGKRMFGPIRKWLKIVSRQIDREWHQNSEALPKIFIINYALWLSDCILWAMCVCLQSIHLLMECPMAIIVTHLSI